MENNFYVEKVLKNRPGGAGGLPPQVCHQVILISLLKYANIVSISSVPQFQSCSAGPEESMTSKW